jgi:hypothetical protein
MGTETWSRRRHPKGMGDYAHRTRGPSTSNSSSSDVFMSVSALSLGCRLVHDSGTYTARITCISACVMVGWCMFVVGIGGNSPEN